MLRRICIRSGSSAKRRFSTNGLGLETRDSGEYRAWSPGKWNAGASHRAAQVSAQKTGANLGHWQRAELRLGGRAKAPVPTRPLHSPHNLYAWMGVPQGY
jgi:hypothetical protein